MLSSTKLSARGLKGARRPRSQVHGHTLGERRGAVRVFSFLPATAQPVVTFQSQAASSVPLGDGHGEAHVFCLYLEPDGSIGPHPTGFGQLFLVVQGVAWVAGADGQPVTLPAGHGAYLARGELHAKGSHEGATVIMVQVHDLTLPPRAGEQPETFERA